MKRNLTLLVEEYDWLYPLLFDSFKTSREYFLDEADTHEISIDVENFIKANTPKATITELLDSRQFYAKQLNNLDHTLVLQYDDVKKVINGEIENDLEK